MPATSSEQLGALPPHDPLHALLVELTGLTSEAVVDVWRLDEAGAVYRYRPRGTSVDVVVKFVGRKWISGSQTGHRELRARLLHHEFAMLSAARAAGLAAPPCVVVRPLAAREDLDFALVEEFAPGRDLAALLAGQAHDVLGPAVDAVAGLLALLHVGTATQQPVDVARPFRYLDKVLGQLVRWQVIDERRRGELASLAERWRDDAVIAAASRSLIHGDATPPHFRFTDDGVTAIDLERATYADPASDLGRLAAELKHLGMRYRGDRWATEPLIRRLYDRYAKDAGCELGPLARRGQLFMGIDLLRISRNSWLDLQLRRELVAEAAECLRR